MIYLFATGSIILIMVSGLLLFLDPTEQEHEKQKQVIRYELLKILSEEFQCSIPDIIGKSRLGNVVDARGVFAYALRTFENQKLREIAEQLEKDHSSVIFLIKRTEDLIFTKDQRICNAVNKIKEKLF
jgi:chromosomal replication initiation ATPase DnaA